MQRSRRLAVHVLLASVAAAQAPYAFHFEFDQPGVLPTATAGMAAFNPTGSLTTTLFGASCGLLYQSMTINPAYGAGFYSGQFGGYPAVGTGMNPTQPAFIEARFTSLGGYGGPGTINDCSSVLGMFPGGGAQLVLNVLTGDVALTSTSGPLWVTPPGTAFTTHTYRIETVPTGFGPVASLYVDGALYYAGVSVPSTPGYDGFYFGDGAGSSYIASNIAWDYVSVGQTTAGIGQPNSGAAALFVNRSNTTSTGQPGLKGPFAPVAAAGTTMTLEWNGPADAPFVLMFGPQNPANSNFGCIGLLDVATPPGYADLTLMFDPFNPIVGWLFRLDGCGKATQTFSVPTSLTPNTPLGNFQGAVFQPSGCPLVLTAAHYVTT